MLERAVKVLRTEFDNRCSIKLSTPRVFLPGHRLNTCGVRSDVPASLPGCFEISKFESAELARRVRYTPAITQRAACPVSEPLTGRFPLPVLGRVPPDAFLCSRDRSLAYDAEPCIYACPALRGLDSSASDKSAISAIFDLAARFCG